MCYSVLSISRFSVEANSYNKSDTAINHVRIDSIQLVITERESIVYKLKEHEKDIEDKVISPIKREEFFGSYILALEAANSWKGYGVGKDIKIETIIVKVS